MKPKNLQYIQEVILMAAKSAGFNVKAEEVHVERTKSLDHGHFATNLAMFLAKRSSKSPRDVADKITKEIRDKLITKTEVAGPGFINLWVEQKFYTTEIADILSDLDEYLKSVLGFKKGGKTMLIDTSHPNIAKPMGVHHLLSTIIGYSIREIYKKVGYKVINDNYLGDYGTQFGKLIYAIKTWGDEALIEANPIDELQKLYVKFHKEAEGNKLLEDFGRLEFKKLEDDDEINVNLWKKIKTWSLAEFYKIYKRLGVDFDEMNGESFYLGKMKEILDAGRKSGVIVNGEGGAWIIMPDDPNDPPTMVRKSDGATLYMTRDLARIAYWEKTWHPDLMVNVVDVAQQLYFRQLSSAANKLKLTHAPTIHVEFGRMQFADGAMSTRKGNIIRLETVLNKAEKRAKKLVEQKASDLSEAEKIELARILGIGSIKYNILHQNRTSNITFNWDKMLSFEGNSAPYLLYTVTRASSVLKKSGKIKFDKNELSLADDMETELVIGLLMYPNALHRAATEFKPNHVANYLYDLAQAYNTFYNALPIIQAKTEDQKRTRLTLTLATVNIMRDALGILGLELPSKM